MDVLWIAPFQKTPNRDNGYDVPDYYAVDERQAAPAAARKRHDVLPFQCGCGEAGLVPLHGKPSNS